MIIVIIDETVPKVSIFPHTTLNVICQWNTMPYHGYNFLHFWFDHVFIIFIYSGYHNRLAE